MIRFPQKKPSIDLMTLPKIRTKSSYAQSQNEKEQTPQKNTFFISTEYKQSKHHKSLSKLQRSLSRHRSEFHELSRTNNKQLSTTFFKQQKLDEFYQEKQKLQKKKVYTMQKQSPLFNNLSQQLPNSNLKVFKNRVSLLTESKNNPDSKQFKYKESLIAIDYRIEMSWLKHQCNDSVFNLSRVGATLNYYNDELFLFGGSPDSSQMNLIFHRFKLESNQWKHVNSIGSSKPVLSLMYHESAMYRENLVFCGGISIHKSELKKTFNPYIFSFNILSQTWAQYNWAKCLKHHSSCMTFNWLIVHGGINEKQVAQSMMYIVQLNFTGNFQFSRTSSFQTYLPLSHHKMITTLNQDQHLRVRLRVDGLIMFGGKDENEELSNSLFYLDSKEIKLPDQNSKTFKKWLELDTIGPKPQKRMAHTLQLLKNKGSAVLIGGINERNEYLSDIWILELFSLTWTLIKQVSLLSQTGQLYNLIFSGIAYHSSCVNESQIYIYGGLTRENVDKQFYLIETQKYKRQSAKVQSRKKLDASSISFKGFQ